jgi:hypothetical protein
MRFVLILAIASVMAGCVQPTAYRAVNGLSLVRTVAPAPRVVDEITVVHFSNSPRVDVEFPAGTPWYAPALAEGSASDQ